MEVNLIGMFNLEVFVSEGSEIFTETEAGEEVEDELILTLFNEGLINK